MRKETWFVAVLVGAGLLLATMGALSSSPSNGEKSDFEGFDSLDEATVTENWKRYFPAQYEGWMRTSEMQETTYGGGGKAAAEDMDIEKINYLEMYPFLKVNYDGFPFSKGYYRSRGHYYALTDVVDTERLPDWEKRPATCIGCKTTDVSKLDAVHGDDWYSMPFSKVVGSNTIGCLDCHAAEDATVRHARDWLDEGMAHGTFANIEPEGRTDLVCAQCHTNYHFNAETRKVELPWTTGLTVEAQLEHYDAAQRSDEWVHPQTGALVAKIQHPEYELYHEGQEVNVHSMLGLQCTDCHMPKATDSDGEEYTEHHWTSPLTHVESTCMGCHSNWGSGGVIARAEGVQGRVYEKQNRIGRELAEFIEAVAEARSGETLDEVTLTRLQQIHREAQFYWDFIWVENSNGFHNWGEAHRVLDKAEALINEGMDVLDSV
ncbi:ammonia-forming cytochrome c nitrite reductase subunit c552 [Wenzhouxiangella limi]|uniref:nitrite reductase (cytochrome; ammonia-forming) n=1 Tax=Wenzhouxiangella limi TaxID=2707351 RepID=A0A845UWL6_9GAMM|nr:ammonia-forming cytochrome c nitrite reductase subunit c552 [Wenzhouxiangella limi]NDY96243.1 ammonia-forming cytochrome c nitrite reductase subunit c552 [Wenzhouxiangella limi]